MTDLEIARVLESLSREDAKLPPEEQVRHLIEAGVIDKRGRVLIGGGKEHKQEGTAAERNGPRRPRKATGKPARKGA